MTTRQPIFLWRNEEWSLLLARVTLIIGDLLQGFNSSFTHMLFESTKGYVWADLLGKRDESTLNAWMPDQFMVGKRILCTFFISTDPVKGVRILPHLPMIFPCISLTCRNWEQQYSIILKQL